MSNIKNSIRDSAVARWTALGIVAFTMMAAYFFYDVMAPLKGMLESDLHWTSGDYGFFTGAYGWLNVFAFMLVFGGLILDKKGPRFTGLMFSSLMVVGALIKYYAISTPSLVDQTILGRPATVMLASIGYAIFAVGSEVTGITVTKIIVKWFKGKEIALAMGLQVALARVGTSLAMAFTLPISGAFKDSISAPLLIGAICLCIGFLAFLGYTFMDKKLDKEKLDNNDDQAEEEFKISDVGMILRNKGFWYLALLCVLFYSCVFPFLKYAPDLMVNKFHVNQKLSGLIPALLPFGTILLTPLFGGIYDKKGKGATIMIIGALLLMLVHITFTIPFLDNWLLAVVLMIILGIAFSLVPSAMWPSVAKIIPEKQLGSAYSLIFWIQNIGLMVVPVLVGEILEKYCVTGQNERGGNTYNYTLIMGIFSVFAFLSIILALGLKREDKKKNYGLEKRNIN